MSPTNRTDAEEAAFMQDLLAGIDDSFFNAVPSPDPPRKRVSSTRIQLSPVRCLYRTPKKNRNGRVASPLAHRSPLQKKKNDDTENLAFLLEGAEDWDWADMEADFLTPKKATPRKQKEALQTEPEVKQWEPDPCARCLVKDVTGNNAYKELLVSVEPGGQHRKVVLQDDWAATDIHTGDIVNITGAFSLDSPSTSTSAPIPTIKLTSAVTSPLLIHHPDILITATSLSNTPTCTRRPLLNNLVRSSTDVTPALVWGNILHEVMQSCLQSNEWDQHWMQTKIDAVIRRNLDDLLRLNVDVEQATREVWARASGLKTFAARYMSDTPKDEATLTNTRSDRGQTSVLAINNLHDIEEDIWSPTYGLKGKIDASVQAVIANIDDSSNPFTIARPKRTTITHPAPFEIKTGRAITGMEHRAQTMLYTLLMSERYGMEVPSGLLYYTQSEEVVRVPTAKNEVRALMMKRNELAGYMMRRVRQESEPFLPPTIDDHRVCGRCFSVNTCMLYRRAVEEVEDDSSPIADIYELKTSHLTAEQTAFFKKWEALISMEEQDLVRFKKELWTLRAEERERFGRCFSNMRLDEAYQPPPTLQATLKKEGKIHQYTYRFVKASPSTNSGDSLLHGQMNTGDAVTVSVEPDLLAFVRGYILELTPEEVVLGVDHALHESAIRARRPRMPKDTPVVLRIDRDELFGGMGRIRDNLAQLFYADGDMRRLELVVDLRSPRFPEVEEPVLPEVEKIMKKLNTNQQMAMRKVLNAEDYALILGMPGTGKTTVIAAIIRALVSMGQRVLLTSYTHSAVDNILMKLKDDVDFGILRLGNIDKIHPDIHQYTLAARKTAYTIEQLENQVMTPPVVATTCLSIDHPLFSRRHFDVCIVDEASQVTLPTCLGPLRFAEKFVLVGDHFQLPPLVRNRQAKKAGLEMSLFRLLSETHPHAVVDLHEQYRMNEDIMLLSNKLIYGDRLRCGSPEVAKRGLVLPNKHFTSKLHQSSTCPQKACWIEHLLDENCKAVFVDTDAVPANDSRVGDLTQNVTEAVLVQQITEALTSSGVRNDQIGIISLYRQQIKLLSHLLRAHKGVEILTADRSQGRDKDCIVVSMVRSNPEGQIGDLLKDWRRINVSFTRARCKLIIVGSRKTLQSAPLLEEFFKLMDTRGWILALPPNADGLHESLSTPLTGSKKRSAEEDEELQEESGGGSMKKARKSGMTEEAIVKGRPLLKDLVNDNQ